MNCDKWLLKRQVRAHGSCPRFAYRNGFAELDDNNLLDLETSNVRA